MCTLSTRAIHTQTRTATPTDATSAQPEQPLGTMRPYAQIPTRSPSPQAPATPCTSTPGYHPPSPAQAEPAPEQRHDPPAGPALRPTEAPSGSQPAPGPDPDPDLTLTTVPADAPRANAPGHKLQTGAPHPEGGTPAARRAAAEGSGGTRALAGHVGARPRPAPVPDSQTRMATPMKDNAATPPALPAHPQREEPMLDATEEARQPKETPLPAADLTAERQPRAEIPSGVTGQPNDRHARTPTNHLPDMAARESSEAPDAGQPSTGPGGPTPDAEHAADPHHQPPTGHTPRVTRAPPHPRPQHTAAMQARRGTPSPGRNRHRDHIRPTQIPTPGQPHPTRPSM